MVLAAIGIAIVAIRSWETWIESTIEERKGDAEMKKVMIACLLFFGIAAMSIAQDSGTKAVPAESFKVGGTSIAIPPPITKMSEAGHDNREFMEIVVAPNNRLIAAFLLTKDLPKLTKGLDGLMISKYAMVQVSRRGEYMDCKSSDFKEVTDSIKAQFGEVIGSSTKKAEYEFNRRMKSLDLDAATVSFGKPIQLGCLFSKQDAYGFGMLTPLSMGGENMKMGMGATLMRVKSRLLFVYLYAEYKDKETVRWLRKTTEDWSDAIMEANK